MIVINDHTIIVSSMYIIIIVGSAIAITVKCELLYETVLPNPHFIYFCPLCDRQ